MKIGFINDTLITCGGLLTNYEYVKELRKRGVEANMYANSGNNELERYYGINHLPIASLSNFLPNDVIIANWWRQVPDLEKYQGKKIQFVQGLDIQNYGEDDKNRCIATREKLNWDIIAVSKYAGEWTMRDYTVIPNGIRDDFFYNGLSKKDIDILIEGNDEENKNIDKAYVLAKLYTDKIAWLGRETRPMENVTPFTNPPQKEIPKIYRRSKILLKLSDSEGFCLPILEAMASGCAVVTQNMGGNDFCQYGYNCETIEKLPDLLNDDYRIELLIRAGKETAQQFKWEKSTDLLLDYLSSLK